ncbi:MAG: YscO family type III secretion system apparatus protein [Rhizobiaceae bacterium]|nr:YscO family type III secretion system apparatus protein [Rhizobiaceae bacterium]
MRVLLRVKELKQDQAFRTMQTKRQQLEAAKETKTRAEETVAESSRTLPAREDAIFGDILGAVVDLATIDETFGRVVQLERSHTMLKDQLERAAHVEHRAEGELEQSRTVYRAAVKVRDKYTLLTDDLQLAADTESEYREEMEVEDTFSRPRGRIE